MEWNVKSIIECPKSGVLSKEIFKGDGENATLFCMASGTEISNHTSTKQGFVYVIEGKGVFTLEGKEIEMLPGKLIFMERHAVHSLKANQNTSFLLFLH